MKTSILRALVAVAVGILMIAYRERMAEWLTIAIGVLFFLSGVISIIFYCVMLRKYNRDVIREEYDAKGAHVARKPMVPIVGVGCAILGIILALLPKTVNDFLVYVFAILLILGAIGQFFILLTTISLLRDLEKSTQEKASVSCGYIYWVLPLLLFLFGLFVIFYRHSIEQTAFLFIGIAMVVYGLSELISTIKSSSVRRYVLRSQNVVATVNEDVHDEPKVSAIEDAQVVDEADESSSAGASSPSGGDSVEDAEIVSEE